MADLKELWKVVKLLLALSHGQATVERGFSNKEVMVENLAQHSLAAQRVICDHVRSEGGVLNVFSSKELLLSTASGRQTYHTALDEKRRENKGIRKEEILTWGNFHFERKEKIGDFVRSPTPKLYEKTQDTLSSQKKTHFVSLFHPLHHCQHHSYHHHHQRCHHLHIQQIGCLHLLHGISCELNGRYMPAVVLYFYQHSQTPSG